MKDLWLVLDTATPMAVVALCHGPTVRAEERLSEQRRHAESLLDAVDRVLLGAGVTLDDVDGIGVGRGPGSFIGIRTGISTAKGIALARNLPVVGLPTLVALAWHAGVPEGRGLCAIDARRGELFVQLVEKRGAVVRPIEEPLPVLPHQAGALAARVDFVVGAPIEGRADTLHAVGPDAQCLARSLLARRHDGATDELASLVPDYCRPPDAKLPATDPQARRGLYDG